MGWDGTCRVTNNEVNVPDLHRFILAVREYTGSERFSIVGHSLGVTVARRTLKVHPELREDLVAFVGIAGANHGTSLCGPGTEGVLMSCDEIAAGTDWLAELNGPDGEDETYGRTAWLTISDGSGAADVAFVGPTYADSPQLAGADNRTYPGTDHNGLRMDQDIVSEYRTFLEDAEATRGRGRQDTRDDDRSRGRRPSGSEAATGPAGVDAVGARTGSDLPTTGGGSAVPVAVLLVAAGLRRRFDRAS